MRASTRLLAYSHTQITIVHTAAYFTELKMRIMRTLILFPPSWMKKMIFALHSGQGKYYIKGEGILRIGPEIVGGFNNTKRDLV